MDISIIFVNYKTKDLTINAIKSVIEQTKDIEYEIFAVDNNSQDGSIEAIEEEFPNINIIKNSVNAGFGAANNLAIRKAQGKYIFCLNTDTILLNNAIKIMFDFMEKDENQNIGACGAYLTDRDNKPVTCGGLHPCLSGVIWKFGLRNLFKKYYSKKYEGAIGIKDRKIFKNLGYITGANLFIRKSILDKTGGFDENLFMYFEDTDLCARIRKCGYKLEFVEAAKIQHLEGKSTKNSLLKKKWFKKSELYFFKKHNPVKFFIIQFMYIVLYLINWGVLKDKDSKDMISFVIKEGKQN